MNTLRNLAAALLLAFVSLVPAASALALGDNLVPNPSLETVSGTGPASWQKDGWGTNTAAYTYENTGHSGSHSVTVSLANYQSGDAKWYFTPVTVAASTSYTFSDWYKSTVKNSV